MDTAPSRVDEGFTCLVVDCIGWSHELPGDAFPSLAEVGGPIVLSRRGGAETRESEADATSGVRADDESGVVSVLDAATGEVRWEETVGLTTRPSRPPSTASVGDQLLVMDRPGRLRSFGLDDGEKRWELAVEGAGWVSQAELAGPKLFVVLGMLPGTGVPGQKVLSVDPENGDRHWISAEAREIALTEAGPVLFDPLLSEALGAMWGLDPNDGLERWREPLRTWPGRIAGVGPLVVSQHNEASVLDAATGTLVATLPSQPDTPHIQPHRSDEHGLVVLDAGAVSHVAPDGSIWTRDVSGCCLASMANPDVVTVLLRDGAVQRFARHDGRSLDTPQIDAAPEPAGELTGLLGGYLVYLQSVRPTRVLVDPETRQPIARLGEHVPLGTTTAGTILLGAEGELVALRPPEALAP